MRWLKGSEPYSVGVHRHEPEIQKELAKVADVKVTFVPHLLPINRGILTTVYGSLKKYVPTAALLDLYRETYRDAPFVRVLDEGAYPDTRFVRYSNYCDIGLKTFEDGRFILDLRDRQPREGRIRPGGAEHEHRPGDRRDDGADLPPPVSIIRSDRVTFTGRHPLKGEARAYP